MKKDWIDIRLEKPPENSSVLVCDDNGYICIEDTNDSDHYKSLGYPTPKLFGGKVPSFEQMWENGNGTKLVAWMTLPDFPKHLCNENADGQMP